MFGCWRVRGLLASGAYEALKERERQVLARHLAGCAACRERAAAFDRLAARIPRTEPTLDIDLLPALRARLREEKEPAPRREFAMGRRWAMAAAAACVLVVASVMALKATHAPAPGTAPQAPVVAQAPTPPAPLPASALDGAVARADALCADRQFAQAYAVLDGAVQANLADHRAGEALQRLADLAFTELHWYDRADQAYVQLARTSKDVYEARPENANRMDLLAEARGGNYASLHALDSAIEDRTGGVAKLEDVIARHPATLVASMAAGEIGRRAAEGRIEPDDRLRALIEIRQACKDPVVVAQLNLEIGHIHRNERKDFVAARGFYEQASQNPALARLAQDAITSLGAGQ